MVASFQLPLPREGSYPIIVVDPTLTPPWPVHGQETLSAWLARQWLRWLVPLRNGGGWESRL
jgi:hypothetical protein